ncbi:MAG: FAD-dependent oxidoreductase [Thaumarchaeota archaeon]|nr:FAD-dependent oxidoreductase [Nitrososphaerota archaeon]
MKLALIIAAVFLFSIYTQTLVTAEESEYHDVIVIGAGIAGLAAANQLNENGYDVIILEAFAQNVAVIGQNHSFWEYNIT